MKALLFLLLLAAPAVGAESVLKDSPEPSAPPAVGAEAAFKRGRLEEHFKKHGAEMGLSTAEEYLAAARRLLVREGVLKKDRRSGDRLYFDPKTNEFAVLAKDGRTIRTFFKPNAGRRYWDKQTRGP
ncbi:MAG: hypothetical protein HY925_12960 [Elusimicrobia bacterium]|nr:hypothetical protein [Elusimicrobiota bacterium]